METPLRIMIVDDDPDIVAFVGELLQLEGYDVLPWYTARGVHEQIHQHQPQLVILDLHLEVRAAGIQILQQLRADAQTTHLPVLLCTVDDTLLQHYHERLVTLHCATLRKPFTLPALLESVVTLIGYAGDASG